MTLINRYTRYPSHDATNFKVVKAQGGHESLLDTPIKGSMTKSQETRLKNETLKIELRKGIDGQVKEFFAQPKTFLRVSGSFLEFMDQDRPQRRAMLSLADVTSIKLYHSEIYFDGAFHL